MTAISYQLRGSGRVTAPVSHGHTPLGVSSQLAAGVASTPVASAAFSEAACPHCGQKYRAPHGGPLTAQQMRVFVALRDANGATVPHAILLRALGTSSEFDADNVLKVAISRIRSKLKDYRIVAIRGEGYALAEARK